MTHYRKAAIRAAKELFYGNDVVEAIRQAKTDDEIIRIMWSARNRR